LGSSLIALRVLFNEFFGLQHNLDFVSLTCVKFQIMKTDFQYLTYSLLAIFLVFYNNKLNAQWVEKNDGLYGGTIYSMLPNGNNLYVGADGGIFYSTDNGITWTASRAGLPPNSAIVSFTTSGASLYVGTNNAGVFRSIDNGVNWSASSAGLPENKVVTSLAYSAGSIYAGTTGGVFRSIDNGANWTPASAGLSNTNIRSIAVSAGNLYIGTYGSGIFRSINSGASWAAFGLAGNYVNSLDVRDGNVYAGTNVGFFRSVDNGVSWLSGLASITINSLTANGGNLYAGTKSGVFHSADYGATWMPVNTGLTNIAVSSVAVGGSNLYAGTNGGVFRSSNSGATWMSVNTGLANTSVLSLAQGGGNLYAGTYGSQVFRSSNNGASWTAVNTGMTNNSIWALTVDGDYIYAGTGGGEVFRSSDKGTTWTSVNIGLPNTIIWYLTVIGGNLYAGTNEGVFRSEDRGVNWISASRGMPTHTSVFTLLATGGNIYAGTGGGVFRSINNGADWTIANTGGLANTNVWSLAVSDRNLYAGTWSRGVFRSIDNGANWTAVNNGLANTNVNCLAVGDGSIFAATGGGGVFRSIDGGASWEAANEALLNTNIRSLVVSGSSLYAGTLGNGIWARLLEPSPTITSFSPSFGTVGTMVSVEGTGFLGVINMTIGGSPATFTVNSDNNITGLVGEGATTGIINITTATGKIATSSQTFVVKQTQTINFDAISEKIFGDAPFILSATSSSDLPVTYASNNIGVASVSGSTITILGTGTAMITASQAGNNNYNPAADVTKPLIVNKASQTITFTALSSKVFGDAQFTLSGTSSSGLALTYASNNTATATVSNNTVTLVGAGNAIITASQPGDTNYNPAAEVGQSLVVNKATPTLIWSKPADIVYGTALSSFQLNSTASVDGVFAYTPAGGTIMNAGSNQNLSVTFTPTDGANYNSVTKQVAINVSKAQQQIIFPALADKTIGDGSFSLAGSANSLLPVNFTSTSDKISIANGQVTLLKAGRVSITASQAGNSNYNAAAVTQSFCIKPPKPTITLSNLKTQTPLLTSNASAGNQWYADGAIIAGANGTTYSATKSGNYKVQVTVDDCLGEFSDEQPLVITGMEVEDSAIDLYPNPVTDVLTIYFGNLEGKKQITVYALTGESVITTYTESTSIAVDVANLATGIYLAKAMASGVVQIRRFNKQ
jgi:ligand-binding sensor domain-containing protein